MPTKKNRTGVRPIKVWTFKEVNRDTFANKHREIENRASKGIEFVVEAGLVSIPRRHPTSLSGGPPQVGAE
jgi:hypothetical protein